MFEPYGEVSSANVITDKFTEAARVSGSSRCPRVKRDRRRSRSFVAVKFAAVL